MGWIKKDAARDKYEDVITTIVSMIKDGYKKDMSQKKTLAAYRDEFINDLVGDIESAMESDIDETLEEEE